MSPPSIHSARRVVRERGRLGTPRRGRAPRTVGFHELRYFTEVRTAIALRRRDIERVEPKLLVAHAEPLYSAHDVEPFRAARIGDGVHAGIEGVCRSDPCGCIVG